MFEKNMCSAYFHLRQPSDRNLCKPCDWSLNLQDVATIQYYQYLGHYLPFFQGFRVSPGSPKVRAVGGAAAAAGGAVTAAAAARSGAAAAAAAANRSGARQGGGRRGGAR